MPEIIIAPYDPEWPARFKAERAQLAAALEGLPIQIDHVGSTSVPGLAAKPIIEVILSQCPTHSGTAVLARSRPRARLV